MKFEVVDGTFPDWRRVLPAKITGQIGQFNAQYLADFQTVSRFMYAGSLVRISHNGTDPALVGFARDDCFGVIMPARTGEPLKTAPAWASRVVALAA